MSSTSAKSQVVRIKKMFVWNLDISAHDDFLQLAANGLCSPVMTSIDPYSGTKHTGIFIFNRKGRRPDYFMDNYLYHRLGLVRDLPYRPGALDRDFPHRPDALDRDLPNRPGAPDRDIPNRPDAPDRDLPNRPGAPDRDLGYRRGNPVRDHPYRGAIRDRSGEPFNPDSLSFYIDTNPNPGVFKYGYFLDQKEEVEGNSFTIDKDCKKLCLYVDVITTRQCSSSTLMEMKSVSENLKQLWKDDPSVKFTIKCKGNTIETSKPFMAASSSVFKAMFDHDWKESSENSIEIIDFDPDVVRQMVKFCENGIITDVEEFEELYRIADKYDIQQLMALTLAKLDQTMTVENVHTRLKMAEQYEMKDLRKRCRVFCAQNDMEF